MSNKKVNGDISATMKKLPLSPPESEFPSDVLKWMKSNANPKMALKLMQICKYFQHQEFPYLVVKTLLINPIIWKVTKLNSDVETLNLKNQCEKIWITEVLRIFSENKNSILLLLPKIAVCDIKILVLANQGLTFEQFKFLTSAGRITTVELFETIIKDENGKIIPLENIFEYLPKVINLKLGSKSNSFVSHRLASKKIPMSLRSFIAQNVSEDFNFEECFKFVQNNQKINFCLTDTHLIRSAENIIQLQMLTNDLLKTWLPKYKPPEIDFNGQTTQSKEQIERMGKLYKTKKFK